FTALSYVWGDESIREAITINGVETSITKLLAEALRQLRSEGKAQNLWADAICINQCDGAEKGIHVGKMGQIYSSAARTYLWLGEKSDSSDQAMDLVENATEERVKNFDPQAAEWRGLYDLLRRPWWSRLWIIQESVLSPEPI
ncbi:heterokaryon incompatibility, partial [Pyrenochaeta sp. MPI-SDFR-AT-0127]